MLKLLSPESTGFFHKKKEHLKNKALPFCTEKEDYLIDWFSQKIAILFIEMFWQIFSKQASHPDSSLLPYRYLCVLEDLV